jgi:hypothetical protein
MPQEKLIAHDAESVFDNIVDVGRDLLRLSIAREFEQSLDNGFAPLGFSHNYIQAFFKMSSLGNLLAHVGTIKQDTGKRVVDFVGDPGRHSTQRRHFIHLGDQLIELRLLVFHQLDPFDKAGALLGDSYNEIQFVIGKLAYLGKIYPNQSSHLLHDGKRHIDNHADAFIPCFLRVLNSRGVPYVCDDFNFVNFRRIGQ